MELVDCFMFNDEVEVLRFRIRYYRNLVTKFIVAESTFTFSGKPKLALAKQIFTDMGVPPDQYSIVHYKPSRELILNSINDRWPIERFARQSLQVEIAKLNPTTRVMLSDVDEIASLEQIKFGLNFDEVVSLATPLCHRKANWISIQGKNWRTFKIGPARFFKDLNELRYRKTILVKKNQGAHFSYLTESSDDLVIKSQNSAHKEHEIDSKSARSLLEFCDAYHVDHLGRFDRKGFGLLRVVKEEKLNKVQKEFLEFSPEYFDFRPPEANLLRRVAASRSVTKGWIDGIGSWNPEAKIIRTIFPATMSLLDRTEMKLRRLSSRPKMLIKRVKSALSNIIS